MLDELLNTVEKDQDTIGAADAVLKAGKVHRGKDEAPPRIVIHLHTIDKQLVIGGDSGEQIDDDYWIAFETLTLLGSRENQ